MIGMKILKNICCCVCIVIVLCISTSCLSWVGNDIKLEVAAMFSVPGMYKWDLKDGRTSIDILETDNQGRTLYRYSSDSYLGEKQESAIVICKKLGTNYVYYYEDLNYIIGSATQEAIDTLKAQNDWNLPLDDTKMSRRKIIVTFDLFVNYEDGGHSSTEKPFFAWLREMQVAEADVVHSHVADCDANGLDLSYVFVNQNGEELLYFVITNMDTGEFSWIRASSTCDFAAELRNFKNSMHWKYNIE